MLQTIERGARRASVAIDSDPNGLLNSATVCQIVGNISGMTLWRWTKERGFPKPDAIIARRKFWRRATIQAWIASQIMGTN